MTNDNKSESEILRQKAEELLKKKISKSTSPLSEGEMQKLIHELEVHQIELELQNEELNHARTAAEVAKDKYTNLYDFSPTGYFSLSKSGDITEVNLTGSKMLDTVRSKLINGKFSLFVSTDTRSIFNNFIDKVFQSKSNETCEVTLSKNDNSPTHVLLTGIVSENEEEYLVAMIDITESKQAEGNLKASEEKFRVITENSADAIFITDQQGNYQYVNNAACNLLGYTAIELTKMNISDISETEKVDEALEYFEQLLNTGKMFVEMKLQKKDGTVVPVDLNAVVLPNGMIYGSCRDITKRKQGEQEILKLKDGLEVQVAEKTKELEEKISELERFFAATVDRELRMEELYGENEKLKTEAKKGIKSK